MPRTEQEKELNNLIYNVFHLQYGLTDFAADIAAIYLDNHIETQNFTNMNVASGHGEFAHQAGNLSVSAARKAGDKKTAIVYASQAATVMLGHYPLGKDKEEVQRRNQYWEPVFDGETNAQIRALRDYMKLLDVVGDLADDQRPSIMVQAILHELHNNESSLYQERGYLITLIERVGYKDALQAYRQFILTHGMWMMRHDRQEFAIVTAKMLSRVEREGKGLGSSIVKKALRLVAKIPKLSKLTDKIHSFSQPESRRYTVGQEDEQFDQQLLQDLLDVTQFGLGEEVGVMTIPALSERAKRS